ncbi:Xaa-Pro dipeptidyl-peptidase [Streptomyces zagrosensis]|uniref:Xaa-Pro dipeptidyl-peptidase n=1 Tax=Streptomyces zagrosensis TaxID=1042984 RepID=A0A7W9QBL8_9ACTN|nr:X-Pro dipeptidyl-peptidase [Streptomyces zagrosensis]
MLKRARGTRIQWTTLILAVVAALMATIATPTSAQGSKSPGGTVTGELSRPAYSYADAIRESVWVDTGLDLDRNGRTDRVAADIVRPSEAARAGRKVPVIMDASPYYSCCGRGNESQKKTYDASGKPVQFPMHYDNYFVPRGYAAVLVDLAGTNRSDGCVDVGGRSDIISAKAVVQWLNGDATAYTSRTGGTKATADWTTGATGMIGKSYDGTVANGVAATGVKGLKTIVPIGAISSWYDYYFAKGAPYHSGGPDGLARAVESQEAAARCRVVKDELVKGAPRTGDWTKLWTERDYVPDAKNVKASVLAVHGGQDLNVRMKHLGQWWDALATAGVERKIWLSQAGHVDPFDLRREQWVDTAHRWFDHYLLGVDNGIEREPMATIEREPDRWTTDAVWPAAGTEATTLRPRSGATPGVGILGTEPATAGSTETFTDDPRLSEADWAAQVDVRTAAKAGFTTRPLAKDLRLSGSAKVTVTATPSTRTAHLSAVLVDVGPDTIRNYTGAGEGISTLSTRSCWGESRPGDSACFLDTGADTRRVNYTIFSRGWADLGNYADDHIGRPLTPGKPHTITLDLAASDHVVKAGHRLALIVAGTDRGLISAPNSQPKLTLDLARTSAELPLVGGAPALVQRSGGQAHSGPSAPLTSVPAPGLIDRLPTGSDHRTSGRRA